MEARAEKDAADPATKIARAARHRGNRGGLPKHLPRIETTVEPERLDCPCCGGDLHPSGEHATRHLDGFRGTLQVDGYAGYRSLTDPRRPGGPLTLAFCWAHCRLKFYEIAEAGHAPMAEEVLKRIAAIYAIEADLRGQPPEARRAGRQARTKPLVDALRPWLEAQLRRISGKSRLAEAIRYT